MEPMNKRNIDPHAVVILNAGETFTDLSGCRIARVPGTERGVERMESGNIKGMRLERVIDLGAAFGFLYPAKPTTWEERKPKVLPAIRKAKAAIADRADP